MKDTTYSLSRAFYLLLERTPWIYAWPKERPFEIGGMKVPSELPGLDMYSFQFKTPSAFDNPRFCYVSQLQINGLDKYTAATSYVAEVEPGYFSFKVERYFQIYMVFDDAGNLVPEYSNITMFEGDEPFSVEDAPPMPPVPGPVGTALDIVNWGMQLGAWISKYLPEDWGALGLALAQIAELIALNLATSEEIAKGQSDFDLVLQNTSTLNAMIQKEQQWQNTKYGICVEKTWQDDDKARVYMPLVMADSASWTMICKVDRIRGAVYDDDHLVVALTIDYDVEGTGGKVIGVESAWKFADCDPEDGEIAVDSSDPNIDCFEAWYLQCLNQLGAQLPKDFVSWFSKTWLQPLIDNSIALNLKEPDA